MICPCSLSHRVPDDPALPKLTSPPLPVYFSVDSPAPFARRKFHDATSYTLFPFLIFRLIARFPLSTLLRKLSSFFTLSFRLSLSRSILKSAVPWLSEALSAI